jgi:E3 ubiquitin-protein ligase RNF115/126
VSRVGRLSLAWKIYSDAHLYNDRFVRRSFENDPHHHDDGMGGAGGAADGRFFNMDNQNNPQPNEEQDGHESDANNRGENTDYPPELASIRDVFANIFGGMGGGDGPASMLIDLFGGGGGRGRTGDYVWGQQGLDDVITQLMEQTRGSTAPPPATEEAIRKLERFSRRDTAKVNQARNRECSTCMDSFQEDEEGTVELSMDSNRLSSTLKPNNDVEMNDDPPEMGPTEDQQDEVIMMPCKHLFHVDCLLPWLKTNGTCPVCRVSLEPKEQDKKQSQSSNESNRQGEASSAVAAEPSSMDVDNDEDESVEAIRGRSRRAAENRMMGGDSRSNDQNSQRVPGSFLQPDELD